MRAHWQIKEDIAELRAQIGSNTAPDDYVSEREDLKAALDELADAPLGIGDSNRDDTVRVSDTSWDGNGALTVTVREMIGGYNGWIGGRDRALRAMRDTARRALMYPEKTRSTRLVREWYADGQNHATFAVSRLGRNA
jgi:hypothetical protein